MKAITRRVPGLLLGLWIASTLVQCVQFTQETTLLPDGSGKIRIVVAVKKSMMAMVSAMGKEFGGEQKNPFDQLTSTRELEANTEGFVAWRLGQKAEDGEWVRMDATGYFEDIGRVRMYDDEEDPNTGEKTRKVKLAFERKTTEAGEELVINNRILDQAKEQSPETPEGDENKEMAEAMAKAMKDMLKGMIGDMKISLSFTVPGAIKESEGFMETDGRTVTVGLTGEMILASLDDPEAKRKLQETADRGRIVWTGNETTEDEVQAFRKEMAEAKESWEKVKKESEAKEAESKKE